MSVERRVLSAAPLKLASTTPGSASASASDTPMSPRSSLPRLKGELYAYLFQMLDRAIYELYALVEYDANEEYCADALEALQLSVGDFQELSSRLQLISRSSSDPADREKAGGIAWEVRMMTAHAPAHTQSRSGAAQALIKSLLDRVDNLNHSSRVMPPSNASATSPGFATPTHAAVAEDAELEHVSPPPTLTRLREPAQVEVSPDRTTTVKPPVSLLLLSQLESAEWGDLMVNESAFAASQLAAETAPQRSQSTGVGNRGSSTSRQRAETADASPARTRLQFKLASPARGHHTPEEMAARHAQAEAKRVQLQLQTKKRLLEASERVRDVSSRVRAPTHRKEDIDARLELANERHASHIAEIRTRAEETVARVHEIAFINEHTQAHKAAEVEAKHAAAWSRALTHKAQVAKRSNAHMVHVVETVAQARARAEAQRAQMRLNSEKRLAEGHARREYYLASKGSPSAVRSYAHAVTGSRAPAAAPAPAPVASAAVAPLSPAISAASVASSSPPAATASPSAATPPPVPASIMPMLSLGRATTAAWTSTAAVKPSAPVALAGSTVPATKSTRPSTGTASSSAALPSNGRVPTASASLSAGLSTAVHPARMPTSAPPEVQIATTTLAAAAASSPAVTKLASEPAALQAKGKPAVRPPSTTATPASPALTPAVEVSASVVAAAVSSAAAASSASLTAAAVAGAPAAAPSAAAGTPAPSTSTVDPTVQSTSAAKSKAKRRAQRALRDAAAAALSALYPPLTTTMSPIPAALTPLLQADDAGASLTKDTAAAATVFLQTLVPQRPLRTRVAALSGMISRQHESIISSSGAHHIVDSVGGGAALSDAFMRALAAGMRLGGTSHHALLHACAAAVCYSCTSTARVPLLVSALCEALASCSLTCEVEAPLLALSVVMHALMEAAELRGWDAPAVSTWVATAAHLAAYTESFPVAASTQTARICLSHCIALCARACSSAPSIALAALDALGAAASDSTSLSDDIALLRIAHACLRGAVHSDTMVQLPHSARVLAACERVAASATASARAIVSAMTIAVNLALHDASHVYVHRVSRLLHEAPVIVYADAASRAAAHACAAALIVVAPGACDREFKADVSISACEAHVQTCARERSALCACSPTAHELQLCASSNVMQLLLGDSVWEAVCARVHAGGKAILA